MGPGGTALGSCLGRLEGKERVRGLIRSASMFSLSNTKTFRSSSKTKINAHLMWLIFLAVFNKPMKKQLWENSIFQAVCDSLEGLKTRILHDSTGGETEGIGVSQEVGRDRGATLFLG